MSGSGTTPPAVTVAGGGALNKTLMLRITLAGILGIGLFQASTDNGNSWSVAAVTGAGLSLGATGVTMKFGGTVALDNTWTGQI